jgi:hypothetical protein
VPLSLPPLTEGGFFLMANAFVRVRGRLEREPFLGEQRQAGVYPLGIIKYTLIPQDFLQGLIHTEGRSVRSAMGHSFHNVGDS